PNELAIDADPSSPGIDTSIVIDGTGAFPVGIRSTAASTPYLAYQVELQFKYGALNLTGRMIAADSPLQLCQPEAVVPEATDGAMQFVLDSCGKSTHGATSFT